MCLVGLGVHGRTHIVKVLTTEFYLSLAGKK